MTEFDTIVIGAGHNGLTCGTYLARAGQRVLVLEASAVPGGLAREREFYPGFRISVCHSLGALNGLVVKELELMKHGFELPASPLRTLAIAADGAPVTIGDDTVAGVDAADQIAYQKYRVSLKKFARALQPFWQKTMPRIGNNSFPEILTFAQIGLRLRLLGREDMLEFLRVASLPMRDLMDENFESEQLKAALAWDGLLGSKLAPRSPNQAVFTLLNRMAGPYSGLHGLPTGGIGSLVASLCSALQSAGAELRCNARVRRILVDADDTGQQCAGVELVDGQVIRAQRVVSSADPKSTFLNLLGARHLEIGFGNRVRRLRCNGYVAKLHLALSALPKFHGIERPDGRMVIAPTMDTIEFAYDDAKYGLLPEQPVMEVLLPSLHEPSLAPVGQHVLSAHVMYVPAELEGGWSVQARDAFVEKLLALLEHYAPGISGTVLHAELMTPADLEQEYLLTGGHWHHVEPALDQLLMMRPTYEAAQYSTPLAGLYLCGAGTHPGGDLSGNPGRNAAREILS